MIARLLALGCLVIAAALGLSLWQADRQLGALEQTRQRSALLDPARSGEIDDRLRDAQRLNLDPSPTLDRGTFALFRSRPGQAIQFARDVIDREPDNAGAWILLERAAIATGDRPLARRARRRVEQLDARA